MIIRVESLNARGLRKSIKRCDILDRMKKRNIDTLLLLPLLTQMEQRDYNEIVDDRNIEAIISGNSTTGSGVAIFLNRTFE